MRKVLLSIVGLAGIGALLLVGHQKSRAAGHGAAPAAVGASDIGDLYTWMKDDGKLVMIMTVPEISTGVQYVFHVGSMANFGADQSDNTLVLCQYDGTDAWCFVGNANETAGGENFQTYARGALDSNVMSDDGSLMMFAGTRDEPFFFNGSGFGATVAAVIAAAPNLVFDMYGCPALDMATSNTLVTQLMTEPGGGTAVDDFAGGNIDAFAVELDANMLTSGGNTLAIWASTRSN